jgi:hypothetical protein
MSLPSHTHHVGIEGPVDPGAVGANATVVNYEELSEEKQQVFVEAHTSEMVVDTPSVPTHCGLVPRRSGDGRRAGDRANSSTTAWCSSAGT